MNHWMTTKEAAEHAQCGIQSIYLGVKHKRLRAARINGRREYRFLAEWIDEWLLASATIEIVNPNVPDRAPGRL